MTKQTKPSAGIFIDLDHPFKAPIDKRSLYELLKDRPWPKGATCATQEQDGEVIYWSCPVKDAVKARIEADLETGLMPILGIGQQIDGWYSDECIPVCAHNWETTVALPNCTLSIGDLGFRFEGDLESLPAVP